jgi:predicted AAA+ superfamily ATPase
VDAIPRHVETLVGGYLLQNFAALLVTGPRAVGKTTSMRHVTRTHLDLSVPAVRDAVAADPDAALQGLDEPVLIDEWQEVPDIVNAVKRAVDEDNRAGRFVLTGSVRGGLDAATWGGTGRLIRVPMYGLSMTEVERRMGNVIDLAFSDALSLTRTGPVDLNRNDYIDLVVAGGFPGSFGLPERARGVWFRSYVQQLVERDAVVLAGLREPAKLHSVLKVVAARTAQEQKLESMYAEAGVARRTLAIHLDLLENLQVLVRLPAWAPSRLRRLVRAPKLHITDSGLAAAVLGADARSLRRDGPLAGSLMETFVAGELLRYASTAETPVELHHLRHQDGVEVDLLAVADDGRVVAFEVKSAARVHPADTRGLRWLRDQLGDAFVAGFALHTGPLPHPVEDRIWALPVAALWRAHRA